jgi:large subunit ribosomal protein L30e
VIDINKAINSCVRTGKTVIGAKKTLEAVQAGRARLVILASNAPGPIREDIERAAALSKIPTHIYSGSKIDLGAACGKPYGVSAMAVREAGDSEILNLLEDADVQQN